MGRSLAQRNPTDSVLSEFDGESSAVRRHIATRAAEP